ncbi:hypothetical protein SteCoe_11295 [Stentor coeruleus]|uniref:Uncharacterized protein n=1 Tax=Stentor coeruleus TaxID=5963 RepID=A0A1R2CDF0_9CILI|nr:hypothetical protein SteCoe_11295 [Stentor coeruleus]
MTRTYHESRSFKNTLEEYSNNNCILDFEEIETDLEIMLEPSDTNRKPLKIIKKNKSANQQSEQQRNPFALSTIDTSQAPTSNHSSHFERYFNFPSHLSKNSDSYTLSKSSKTSHKSLIDLPERLSWQKQITENKIKFLRIEKEIKELEGCTFKPQTNTHKICRSISYFTKQQEAYKKSKNSNLTKLKLQYSTNNASCEVNLKVRKNKKIKQGNATVHDRLYEDSKIYSKYAKLTKRC